MSDLWSRLTATASAAAEHAAVVGAAAVERAAVVGAAAAERAAVQAQAVRALAAEQVDRLSAMEVSEIASAAAETAERLRDRAARVGEQAAARAGELAADAAETLGELAVRRPTAEPAPAPQPLRPSPCALTQPQTVQHAERRAELADRLRALLLSDEDGADDVAGERDTDLGVSAALLSFLATVATLPMPPPGAPHPPPLTRWQVAHTKAVLAKSSHLAQLRSSLCPASMSEHHFWHSYFELCGERIVPAAEAPPSPSVLLAPPGEQAAPRRHSGHEEAHSDEVHTLVAADASSPPLAAVEAHAGDAVAHAGDGDGALEDFLQAVLTPGGAASDADEAGGDAALEEEFAALLRGESGSSLSLESADDAEAQSK